MKNKKLLCLLLALLLTLPLASCGSTDSTETTGYSLSEVDMTTAGTKTITVTYGDKSAEFSVEVYNKLFPDANTGVSVEVTVPGATEIKVETVTSSNGTVTAVTCFDFYCGFIYKHTIRLLILFLCIINLLYYILKGIFFP